MQEDRPRLDCAWITRDSSTTGLGKGGRPSGSYRLVARIEMSRTATSSALQVQERLTHGSSRFTPTQGTQASYASARNRFRSRLVSVFGETESRKSGTPFLSIAMIWAYNAYRFRNQKGKSRLEFPERSMQTTELLVIGAGPYGLCIAAHARDSGLGVVVVGEAMAFWKHNMPRGMLLRSGLDWHLDASGMHTLQAFLEERRIPRFLARGAVRSRRRSTLYPSDVSINSIQYSCFA